MKILFILKKKINLYMNEYLSSLRFFIDFDIFLSDVQKDVNYDIYDIIVHVQNYPKQLVNINKSFLLNTEQLSRQLWFNNISRQNNLVDYSKANINLLKKECLYFPYGYNPKEIYNFEKIYDVVFIGELSNRRKHIIDELSACNINVMRVKGFGKSRDNLLFRSKILINIHAHDDYQIFESIRCNRCIYNKVIVISENSLYQENELLHDKIIFCEYSKIIDKIKHVLENYNNYYHDLYNNYDEFINQKKMELSDIYKSNLNYLCK